MMNSKLGLVALLALFSACTPKTRHDTTVAVVPTFGDVRTLDPARAYDGDSMVPLSHVYERLYTYKMNVKNYEIIPQLAEALPTYSDGGKTLTIQIRKGIRFQDDPCFKATNGKGRELTAADFVYGMKRLAHPWVESQGRWVFEGKVEGFDAFTKKIAALPKPQIPTAFEKEQISGIQATGPYTIQIKTIKPFPQLIYLLAMHFTSPFPWEATIAYGDDKAQVNEHPVGTGPFQFKSWEHGKSIEFVRNTNYTATGEGRPDAELAGLEFRAFKDELPTWLEFLKGNLTDILVPSDQIAKSIDTKTDQTRGELKKIDASLESFQGLVFYWININTKDPFLSNKKVRQAISSAIDRDVWLDLFQGGAGAKQVAVLPPGLAERSANPTLKYDFNLERAKKLMIEAGYPDGKGAPAISFLASPADSKTRQFCEFITNSLAKIGIKVKVETTSMNIFFQRMNKKDHQLAYWSWTIDYPDAENVYQMLYGKNLAPGLNYSNFTNAEFDQLFDKMAYMKASPERTALSLKMDDLVQEEVPWALGVYTKSYIAMNGKMKGYRSHPFVMDKYRAAKF